MSHLLDRWVKLHVNCLAFLRSRNSTQVRFRVEKTVKAICYLVFLIRVSHSPFV